MARTAELGFFKRRAERETLGPADLQERQMLELGDSLSPSTTSLTSELHLHGGAAHDHWMVM